MRFALLIHEGPVDWAARTDAAAAPAYHAAWRAYVAALSEAGVLHGGAGLQPPATAALLRQRDGATQVLDGPYAETREQLGGILFLDVPDLDAALAWAARCPAVAGGTIELRPFLVMPG